MPAMANVAKASRCKRRRRRRRVDNSSTAANTPTNPAAENGEPQSLLGRFQRNWRRKRDSRAQISGTQRQKNASRMAAGTKSQWAT